MDAPFSITHGSGVWWSAIGITFLCASTACASANVVATFWSGSARAAAAPKSLFAWSLVVAAIAQAFAAVVLAVGVMLVFANAVSEFVERHPTIKMLALSFLILIGVLLVADGLGQHIPKGYVYFAMAFSLGVEMLNLRLRKKVAPVEFKRPSVPEPPKDS